MICPHCHYVHQPLPLVPRRIIHQSPNHVILNGICPRCLHHWHAPARQLQADLNSFPGASHGQTTAR